MVECCHAVGSGPAIQRSFLLHGVKSTAGPRPRMQRCRTLECGQPSPSLCYAMLAATANNRGAKGEEGQETLHARVQLHCEPASLSLARLLVGRGAVRRTPYVASADSHPHQKARSLLCSPLLCPSPKLPPLHTTASPQQKVHSTTAHAKASTSIVRAHPRYFALSFASGLPLVRALIGRLIQTASNCTHSIAFRAGWALSTPCRRVIRRDSSLLICC